MTPAAFRAMLKTLGLTSREFAALTGIHPVTVSRWGKDTPIPLWVPLLLGTSARLDVATTALELAALSLRDTLTLFVAQGSSLPRETFREALDPHFTTLTLTWAAVDIARGDRDDIPEELRKNPAT